VFLKGKSTEHALLHITNKIGQALNENKYCVGVFLDLKKAFDVVPHSILLKKLEKLGITGTALAWFESYLSNRTQKVDINGHLSETALLDALSVFQGTSLGPILFLCFINDLPRATDLFSILYADDTTGLDSDTDLQTLMTRVSMELRKMAIWFQSN
jgi:methylaspartate ammonia-lyase